MKGPQVRLPSHAAAAFHLTEELGWTGAFTRDHAPEAKYLPGERIRKTKTERNDRHPIGTRGKVLGSIYVPEMGVPGYFIEWESAPRVAVFVVGWKIEADTKEST